MDLPPLSIVAQQCEGMGGEDSPASDGTMGQLF